MAVSRSTMRSAPAKAVQAKPFSTVQRPVRVVRRRATNEESPVDKATEMANEFQRRATNAGDKMVGGVQDAMGQTRDIFANASRDIKEAAQHAAEAVPGDLNDYEVGRNRLLKERDELYNKGSEVKGEANRASDATKQAAQDTTESGKNWVQDTLKAGQDKIQEGIDKVRNQ